MEAPLRVSQCCFGDFEVQYRKVEGSHGRERFARTGETCRVCGKQTTTIPIQAALAGLKLMVEADRNVKLQV